MANGIVEGNTRIQLRWNHREKLDQIRDRFSCADWHSMWAFHKLKRFVEYRSEERAAFVDTVHPGNTSQR
ncbi:MAG: hypothetical protein J07HQX50_01009 [Haloquadratum sp. J07HQX50]|nr:MAG: hypothetical protein J07HQX50_01009 [Haloquadratum sp. J07HQX50]